jgi:hypothetical protein
MVAAVVKEKRLEQDEILPAKLYAVSIAIAGVAEN